MSTRNSLSAQNVFFLSAASAAIVLSGCGGGGGGGADGLGSGGDAPMIVWKDSVNGSTVKDADNDSFEFTDGGVLSRSGTQYPGVKVSNAEITWSGNRIGVVALVDAQGGGRLAATNCLDGTPMNLTFLSDRVEYNCVATGGPTTTEQGGGKTTAGHSFVTWTGSALEDLIKDADDDYFAVEAATRRIAFLGTSVQGPVAYASPTFYANTQVDSAGNVIIGGYVVGVVAAGLNGLGQKIAVLQCRDGSAMSLASAAGSDVASYSCTGTSGSSSDGGGSAGGGSSMPSFINWTGSINGSTVKDAGNEDFAFTSDTGCLYSINRQSVTSNFCLLSKTTHIASFAGQEVHVVRAKAVNAAGCIAVLSDPQGNQIDIFTDGSGTQIVQRSSTQWDVAGCS